MAFSMLHTQELMNISIMRLFFQQLIVIYFNIINTNTSEILFSFYVRFPEK